MIFWKTWREVRWMALVYLLLLQGLLVAAIAYWPHLAEQLQRRPVEGLIPAPFLRRILQAMRAPDEAVAYPAYLAVQHFFKGVNITGIACAVLLGTGVVARERENGTLEFLLARPIGRGTILAGKSAVVAACVVLPIFLTSASAVPLSAMVGRSVDLGVMLHASWHSALFVLNCLCLTVLLSALLRAQVHVAFAVGGFIVAQVGIYFVQVLRAWSVFRLSDFDVYGPILAGNVRFWRLFWAQEVWMLLAALALYAAAHAAFRRSDL